MQIILLILLSPYELKMLPNSISKNMKGIPNKRILKYSTAIWLESASNPINSKGILTKGRQPSKIAQPIKKPSQED